MFESEPRMALDPAPVPARWRRSFNRWRRWSWRDELRRAIAALLVLPLIALGCALDRQSGSEEVESRRAAVSAAAFQNLANQIAFDPAYVALQLKSIELTATILPRAAALTEAQIDLLTSDDVTDAKILTLTGVTQADLDELAELGAAVRARFPWIASHGIDLHRVATLTNPQLFNAYESALNTVPGLAVATRNPFTPGQRMNSARSFMLSRVVDNSESEEQPPPDSDPPDGNPGYCCWAQDIGILVGALAPIAIIIIATAINPALGAAVALAVLAVYLAVFIVIAISQVIDDVIDWFEDTAEWLDESFGHDDDECSDEGDCPSSHYCDNGDVLAGVFGTNTCKPDKSEGQGCWKDAECQSGCCKVHWFHLQCRPADKCD